eukprot:CAMPEP_0118686778 /NCGR_PEP_ID=MMETSP0800-20121206/8007_1 /TAXON_ID=210618 ORGANISM="Striatella unipunctata, Strain CCMP2910" /NCGR_SAMPLE_ID=MMETSP0800 /ASSEMBLY_ACC=CAM_ASM_000638 /LENGTH=285 /DNA_ID=CAMNT_0006583871 /DNA_START=90 /DNA_END=948 /DNA_ORIENTATION=+
MPSSEDRPIIVVFPSANQSRNQPFRTVDNRNDAAAYQLTSMSEDTILASNSSRGNKYHRDIVMENIDEENATANFQNHARPTRISRASNFVLKPRAICSSIEEKGSHRRDRQHGPLLDKDDNEDCSIRCDTKQEGDEAVVIEDGCYFVPATPITLDEKNIQYSPPPLVPRRGATSPLSLSYRQKQSPPNVFLLLFFAEASTYFAEEIPGRLLSMSSSMGDIPYFPELDDEEPTKETIESGSSKYSGSGTSAATTTTVTTLGPSEMALMMTLSIASDISEHDGEEE